MVVKIGDEVMFKPSGFGDQLRMTDPSTGKRCYRKIPGKVVYIHPKGRYFTVEAEMGGRTIRECLHGTRLEKKHG